MAAALLVAATAWRQSWLTTSGAIAAAGVGGLAMTAGWRWGTVLFVFFVSSTALSRLGGATKARVAESRTEKTGARDAWQVLANGGAFAVGAAAAALVPDPWSAIAGAGALGAIASATGDTWATEVGVLFGRNPRSIISWRAVPPGTSGGISVAGTVAGMAGVLLIGGSAMMLHFHQEALGAIVAGGASGLVADSFIGATAQSQRWCPQCDEITERSVHACGTVTAHRSGAPWLTNDGVNALATMTGAIIAATIAAA
jgi:uncharacterized protein (TIGR00297 family)